MTDGIEYFDLVTRVPLWASIPEHLRATEADVRSWHGYNSRYADDAARLLHNPRCIIAIKNINHRGLYTPCAHTTADGAERCAYHGGPSAAKVKQSAKRPTRDELLREVEALRKRVQS